MMAAIGRPWRCLTGRVERHRHVPRGLADDVGARGDQPRVADHEPRPPDLSRGAKDLHDPVCQLAGAYQAVLHVRHDRPPSGGSSILPRALPEQKIRRSAHAVSQPVTSADRARRGAREPSWLAARPQYREGVLRRWGGKPSSSCRAGLAFLVPDQSVNVPPAGSMGKDTEGATYA